MRPIQRGLSPQTHDFSDYSAAKPELVSRLGPYCSYCERRVVTQLAVEHIQPKKGPNAYPLLIGRWENFLLACVNCNSTKGDKNVNTAQTILPDRDNTFFALHYLSDGTIAPSAAAKFAGLVTMVTDTLKLTGLDKPNAGTLNRNGIQVALDRTSQRMEVWLEAEVAKTEIERNPTNQALRNATANLAATTGFFSIWMTIFNSDQDMRNRLIDAFPGVRRSGCFDPSNTNPISPAPNPDSLANGGNI